MREYFAPAEEGVVLRDDLHDKFFADLHETLRAQDFDDQDVRYEQVEGGTVEVMLPPPGELIHHVQMLVRDDCIAIVVSYPAMRIGSSDDTVFTQEYEYMPPPADGQSGAA